MLVLSNGKQIKLFGTSIGIGKTLEIGECYAPNILATTAQPKGDKSEEVQNPHHLTEAEIMEIADFNIRLWLDLKDNLRKFGTTSNKVFRAGD